MAVIAGSAVNQDGRSSGLTVPNGAAQQALVRDALSHARKEPAHVSYVEAHGTGTSLGDPIEANALGAVLGVGRPKDQPLLIGSVKTNVGHLEAASGIVGLIKVILSLQHKEIPPSLHFKTLNPNISMADSPLQVVTECIPWASEKGARTAGVSSYGLSGTNAHIILEEAPTPENSQSPNEPNLQLLTLSAKSEGALRELAERYKKHLASTQPQELADLCFTANVGRSKFEHRLALVADTPGQMQRGLELFVSGEENPGIMQGRFKGSLPPRPVFLFTGQGSQYIGMGQKLFETQPVYRRTLERCDELLRPHLEHSLLSVIFPNQSDSSLLDETMYTQPALFAVECSLVELWRSGGIEPIAVLGHSVGEYVAAWAAGIFSLEDGIKLIAARGRLMQERCEKGSMAVISANEEQVTRILGAYRDHVSIAALNGPLNTVISGGKDAVEEVQKKFEESQIKTKFLKVSHAFHSMLMDPMLDPFEEIAREIQYSAPQLGFTSNLTGRQLSGGQGIDASYWKSHVREPVRFLDGMRILLQQGHRIFLEIGPSPILLGMAKSCADDRDLVWLPSLRKERDDGQQMLGSLAQLYVRGAEISWTGLDPESKRRRVVLPTYPFERKRFWIESAEEDIEESKNRSPHSQVESIPLLGERLWVAGIKNLIFKRRISSSNPDFLIDHQFYGKVVYPATAYLEMGLTAASEVLGGKQGLVEDFSIREALILSSDETRTLQTVVNEEGGFEIFSSPDASPGSWSLHATGRVRSDEGLPESEYNIDNIRQRCQETIDPAGYYAKIRENEVEYGQQFQGIKELWRRDGESFGEICIADTTLINTNPYHIHPGLLDSCFQMLGPALPNFREVEERGEVYMPVGGERFRLKGKVGNRFYCLAQVRTKAEMPNDMFCADLHLFNTDGKVFGEVTGLRLKQIKREALKNQVAAEINDWLYELVWDRADLQEEPLPKRNGHWLIFADRGGLGQELATQLELRGNGSKVVRSGRETQSTGGTLTILNPEDRNSFRQLFEESGQNGVGAYTGIIHLSSLDSEREQDIESSQIFGCASLLHLAQELTAGKISPSPRLWVVTRGAQAVLGNQEVSVRQAPVWGLCRVVALEHPELQCVRIDLDPAGQRDEAITLLQEIESGSSEDQVAFRQEQRHVARLARCREEVLSMESQKNVIDSPVRLEITERGILDNLRLQPLERRLPGRGEVEIRVHATGLNFRDVLNAMGMYAGDPGPLGGECAGTITAVGEGVDTLSVGNEVMALASDSFATHVTVHAQFVLPNHLYLHWRNAWQPFNYFSHGLVRLE
ncbi:MAG: polyketide synthase dehydratase domain-containing protein [Terriglobia bacterium]